MNMAKFRRPRFRLLAVMATFQIILGSLVITATLITLFRFSPSGFLLHDGDSCPKFYRERDPYAGFDLKALSSRMDEALDKLVNLQMKLEKTVHQMGKTNMTSSQFKSFLANEFIPPVYSAHISLKHVRIPIREDQLGQKEYPLINYFNVEEIRKYITLRKNRLGKINVYGTETTMNAIGHACVVMKKELEEYMSYDVGNYCKEDWHMAQRLMIGGCDPLPRRRCLTRASRLYLKPLPMNESLWKMPDDRNVGWTFYQCKNFSCLAGSNPKGVTRCTSCFNLEKEKTKWVQNSSVAADFLIKDVVNTKPGEIRIGLDISIGTGSFAARMREHNVTIVTTSLNLGAPFSEMIALRGLIPLHLTVNQRLPFYDNTLDLIHTNEFLDGWTDLQLMDFVLFDWDRVLRPGGLLWIDRFFCRRRDLDDYMYMFLQFGYKKHKWIVSSKNKQEVYLSAVLEKPRRNV